MGICLFHSGIETQVEELEKKLDMKFEMLEKSIQVAKDEMDRRLEGMNEFRSQLSHQAATFISIKEVTLLLDKLEESLKLQLKHTSQQVDDLRMCQSESKGNKQWSNYILTVVISAIVYLIAQYVIK